MCLRLFALMIFCVSPLAFAGGKMLKPMPGPGTGEAVNGLRATISCVKESFGPGESVLVIWKLANESDQEKTVELYKRYGGNYDVVIRHNGKTYASSAVRFDQAGDPFAIEPGRSITRMIDLLQLKFEDDSWRNIQGSFEVSIKLATAKIPSGTASFKITAAGENKPAIAPELAESIRTLISQLGDNEFATREKAYAELRRIGRPALGMLDEVATANGDLEVVARCKKLIEEIRRGQVVLPPPPFNPPPPPVVPPGINLPAVQPQPVPLPKPVKPAPKPVPGVKPPRPPDEFEF
jgi:hypothetical protein